MKIKLKCNDCGYKYTLYDFEYFNFDYDISCPECGSLDTKEIERKVEQNDTIPK